MTDPAGLIASLYAAGAVLSVVDGELRCRAPRGALPPPLRTSLVAHKVAIVAHLQASAGTFAPLDLATIEAFRNRYTRQDIESRLARLESRATQPNATALDRQLADDWRRILGVRPGQHVTDVSEQEGEA